MSHKLGAQLGGIRTVEDLRIRCHVDEDTGCWIWRYGKSQGAPRVHLAINGINTAMRGRQAAMVLLRGGPLPAGQWAFPRMCCSHTDCVNPAHTRTGSRKQWGEWCKATGKLKTPSRSLGAFKSWGKRKRRFTADDITYIRSSDESVAALAKHYGCWPNTIHQVRQYITYRNERIEKPGASVFSWRP